MHKTFAGDLDALEEMIQSIKNYARKIGFSPLDLSRLELTAEEVLVNIITYGYPQEKGEIEIDCSRPDDNTLKIVITDHGIPFDPVANAKKIDITAPLEERTYGGYGIFLTLKVMDQVDYKRENDANILTMIKQVSLSS